MSLPCIGGARQQSRLFENLWEGLGLRERLLSIDSSVSIDSVLCEKGICTYISLPAFSGWLDVGTAIAEALRRMKAGSRTLVLAKQWQTALERRMAIRRAIVKKIRALFKKMRR